MKTILAILIFLLAVTASAADPAPCCPPGTVCPAAVAAPAVVPKETAKPPVTEAIITAPTIPADLQAAMIAVEKDKADVAAAKTAYAAAQLALTSGTTALATDTANERVLHDKYYPAPGPTPTPDSHTMEVLMISGSGCVPCLTMKPIVAKLAAQGLPVRTVEDTSHEGQKWNVTSVPTFILIIDGKEVLPSTTGKDADAKRQVGAMTESQLSGWIAGLQEWMKKKFPPKGGE